MCNCQAKKNYDCTRCRILQASARIISYWVLLMTLRCWSGFTSGWVSHWAAVQCSQRVGPVLGWPLTFKKAFWWLTAVIHPAATLQTSLKRDTVWSLLDLIQNHQQKHFKEWSSMNWLKTSWQCKFFWRRKLSQSGQPTWQLCWCLRSGEFERSRYTVVCDLWLFIHRPFSSGSLACACWQPH